jgi:hypothetical protein
VTLFFSMMCVTDSVVRAACISTLVETILVESGTRGSGVWGAGPSGAVAGSAGAAAAAGAWEAARAMYVAIKSTNEAAARAMAAAGGPARVA